MGKRNLQIKELIFLIENSKLYYAENYGNDSIEYKEVMDGLKEKIVNQFESEIWTKGEKDYNFSLHSEEVKSFQVKFKNCLLEKFNGTKKDNNQEVEGSEVMDSPKDPQEVLKQTTKGVLAGSYLFAKSFSEVSTNERNLIASEVVHLCLSVADKEAYLKLSPQQRGKYGDYLTGNTLNDFILTKLNIGENQVEPYFNKMSEVLQHRMGVYGQCSSLMGGEGGHPPCGSMVFAFNYFVHRILNPKVKGFRVSDVLIGKEKVSDKNRNAFAEPKQMFEWTCTIVPILTELKLGMVIKSIG